MKLLPESLQVLVGELSKLPGVGSRTALRYAVSLLQNTKRVESLAQSLHMLADEVGTCDNCHFWTEQGMCSICEDSRRTSERLCVVRSAPDVLALEKFRAHPWKYHVLEGFLSPLTGVGPDDIRLKTLFSRLEREEVKEVILAFDATVEGDATALFIRQEMRGRTPGTKLTRTAMGLPAGSSVEFLDPSTLENALEHRTALE